MSGFEYTHADVPDQHMDPDDDACEGCEDEDCGACDGECCDSCYGGELEDPYFDSED